MITEVTIYEKNDKLYCPACKPKGGKKGTFGTSEYDHFCAGCGEDLKEIGERQVIRIITLLFSYDSQGKGYFSIVHPQQYLYRDFGIMTQFSAEEWFAWSANAKQQGFTIYVIEGRQHHDPSSTLPASLPDLRRFSAT